MSTRVSSRGNARQVNHDQESGHHERSLYQTYSLIIFATLPGNNTLYLQKILIKVIVPAICIILNTDLEAIKVYNLKLKISNS